MNNHFDQAGAAIDEYRNAVAAKPDYLRYLGFLAAFLALSFILVFVLMI